VECAAIHPADFPTLHLLLHEQRALIESLNAPQFRGGRGSDQRIRGRPHEALPFTAFLFEDSKRARLAAAIHYSLVESRKANYGYRIDEQEKAMRASRAVKG
jgi:hypothetical protein